MGSAAIARPRDPRRPAAPHAPPARSLAGSRRRRARNTARRAAEAFAREWLDTYPATKSLKRSTIEGYTGIIERHLIPAFGRLQLEAIDVATLDGYVARKLQADYAPRTLNRHLNLLHELFKAAEKRGLARSNPVSAVDRPREPRKRRTILTPVEIGRIERAFVELIDEADGEERRWRRQARTVFLVLIGVGLRRGELLGLRWRDVALADPEGATLRVRETWVRGAPETPKSEAGERTIALDRLVADELFQHRARTKFSGDDERVFCSQTGGPIDPKRYGDTFALALGRGKVDKPMRPFQDVRHSHITNSAAAGLEPAALMARAGHSDFKTTQGYIDLAGERFREEAERVGARVFASVGQT